MLLGVRLARDPRDGDPFARYATNLGTSRSIPYPEESKPTPSTFSPELQVPCAGTSLPSRSLTLHRHILLEACRQRTALTCSERCRARSPTASVTSFVVTPLAPLVECRETTAWLARIPHMTAAASTAAATTPRIRFHCHWPERILVEPRLMQFGARLHGAIRIDREPNMNIEFAPRPAYGRSNRRAYGVPAPHCRRLYFIR